MSPCERVQEILEEALLARSEPPEEARAHLLACPSCSRHRAFLEKIGEALAVWPAPAPRPESFERARSRARRALAARRAPPPGYGRDLLRALALAIALLPVLLAVPLAIERTVLALAGDWLPAPLRLWLGWVYFGSLALVLGTFYGSIPIAVALARQPGKESRP